jgi:GAF domain-containing protein
MNRPTINQFFIPFGDEPQSFRRMVLTVQFIVLGSALAILFFVTNLYIMLGLAILVAVTLLISLRGLTWPGQIVTPLAITIVSTIFMLEGSGTHDTGIIGLIGSVIVAGLLLGIHGLFAFGVLAIIIFLSIGIAEVTGVFIPPVPAVTTLEELIISPLILLALVFALRTLINRLRQIAVNARENEQASIAANEELVQLKNSLETRINERTVDLERRASQMEAVSSVARSITAVQELDDLLPSICKVVSEQFGFYHTGIFLLDERSEYAVLQAANSKGGQDMLKRGHRLRVGATGIVGTVAGQGKARIALDVGADSAYFNNPDLPDTRSEMALPLRVGSQLVGVLDVQSKEVNAFQEEDIAVLEILANQVSIAIGNARLFSQTKQSLEASQAIYQQFVEQDWARFVQTIKHTGYVYDGVKTAPIDGAAPSDQSNAIQIPIRIHGLPVGNITIQSTNPLRSWSQSEINLAQAAAERAGLAVENYRLLIEAQRRAAKERTVSEITARIGSSVDLREIMQTAVEEIGHALSGSEVTVQFSLENK